MFAVSLVRTAFFLAPGIIPLSQIGGTTNDLVRLNPLTGLFESYRSVLLYGSAPEPWMLLYPDRVLRWPSRPSSSPSTIASSATWRR